MLYHGFYVEFIPTVNIPRTDKDGKTVYCRGYEIRIYLDSKKESIVDGFYAAEGFEIVSAVIEDAEQFAKDVIDIEQKKYVEGVGEM